MRKIHMRHNERRSLRIILDNFVLPIVCQWGTSFKKKHQHLLHFLFVCGVRLRLKCDGTRAETRFRLTAKRTSPFKSAWASVQSTTGSRGVRISGSNAGYTMFRGSV